ncbi:MAG: DUF2878 domain-containing protein [Pseudomonadota bacterium]
MKSIAINLTLFKIGWVAVVASAAAGMAEVGVATVALVVLVHLLRAERANRESLLLVVAACAGLAWESLLVSANVLAYPTTDVGVLAPYWIIAMWVLFATTLNVGMQWLQRNILIAGLAGAIGGPLSFLAGEKIGAVAIGDGGLWVIAAGWAVLMPTMSFAATRLNGFTTPTTLVAKEAA